MFSSIYKIIFFLKKKPGRLKKEKENREWRTNELPAGKEFFCCNKKGAQGLIE